MNRRDRYNRNSTVTVGWLFADLLLALAMIFLIANTVNGAPKIVAKMKPTPTLVPSRTPSPTPVPRLETQYKRIILQIDANRLLQNDQNAINQIKQQLRSQKVLQGRDVGLVIVYGGAPSPYDYDIETAQTIASKIYDIMRSLAKKHFAFTKASYYDPVHNLGASENEVMIDVFLFQQ